VRRSWTDGVILSAILLAAALMARWSGTAITVPAVTPSASTPTPTSIADAPDLHVDDVPKVEPAQIAELPQAVVSDLKRQSAKILTRSPGSGPDVVQGRFYKPSRKDWVVRASLPSQQWATLVYPGGRGPAEMLQVAGPSVPQERGLEVVPPKELSRCYKGAVYDGFTPRHFDHDGLGVEESVALWSAERQTWLWTRRVP